MSETTFSKLIAGYSFLEAPRWHQGRLWLSDFYTHQVIAVGMDGKVEPMAKVPGQPSGLGWLPDGRLLVVSMLDRKLMRQEKDGSLVEHADLSTVATGNLNDMVVDTQGRAYVGNFGFDLMGGGQVSTAKLACVQPDGSVSVAAHDMHFPNGCMITPDGKTLIVAETTGNRISAFNIAPGGALGPRRDWASFGPVPVGSSLAEVIPQVKMAPDGATLDAEGAVWAADALGQRVLRVAQGGQVLQEIRSPNLGLFACALGGPDGKTLFVCAAPDFDEHARKAAREAEVWTVQVAVPGAGTP